MRQTGIVLGAEEHETGVVVPVYAIKKVGDGVDATSNREVMSAARWVSVADRAAVAVELLLVDFLSISLKVKSYSSINAAACAAAISASP